MCNNNRYIWLELFIKFGLIDPIGANRHPYQKIQYNKNTMGKLIDGKWVEASIVSRNNDGGYERVQRGFLDTISLPYFYFKIESRGYLDERETPPQ
jgi:hypothetical protein